MPFVLDGRNMFRYTARLRPGGGTADASVSKTDIERCVGSNPTPGTTSLGRSPDIHLLLAMLRLRAARIAPMSSRTEPNARQNVCGAAFMFVDSASRACAKRALRRRLAHDFASIRLKRRKARRRFARRIRANAPPPPVPRDEKARLPQEKRASSSSMAAPRIGDGPAFAQPNLTA